MSRAPENATDCLLELRDVRKVYRSGRMFATGARSRVVAVDGISLAVAPRETVAIVGESGSGKSTTARMLLGLEPPTEGAVFYRGRQLGSLRGKAWDKYRSAVQSVFQDPWSSLDPHRKMGASIAEPLKALTTLSASARDERVAELLELVGLGPWVRNALPHELSGGMRQRVSIARAIAPWPECIVLDEPVSALDVSIKAQVMNLLKDLQERLDITYVLIAHDLATVRFLANRTAVMYRGRIVELAPSEALFTDPQHPYTRQLVAASLPVGTVAVAAPDGRSQLGVEREAGDLPCPRCGMTVTECLDAGRGFAHVAPGHLVACGRADDDPAREPDLAGRHLSEQNDA